MAMQNLDSKAEELEKMRLSRDAVAASAEKEKDNIMKLRADIAQLHTEKVTPLSYESAQKQWACALALAQEFVE